ncbi:MAG TPA: hypothetical protein VKR52_04675 [Terracidiphilus sp.]|nr:hypothetical protein [Terracidiphilus sp.]
MLAREMGWTWEEYRAQPQWFVMNHLFMLQSEAEEANRRSKG